MLSDEDRESDIERVVNDFAWKKRTLSETCHELKFLGFSRTEAEAHLERECPERFEPADDDLSPLDQAKLDNYNFVHDTTL